MHAPIPAVFSLFFLPLSFFLSVLFLLLISNYYLAVGCFSHLGLFPFRSPSQGAYYFLTMGFFPQVPPPPQVPFFRCFSLFPCFSSPSIPLFFAVVTFILQQTDSMRFLPLPLGLHQLFLVCCGHLFKITHSPIGCPYHYSVHVCCNATHFTTKFPFCLFLLYTSTSLPSSMACIRWSLPFITSFG